MKRSSLLLFTAFFLLLFAGCGQKQESNAHTEEQETVVKTGEWSAWQAISGNEKVMWRAKDLGKPNSLAEVHEWEVEFKNDLPNDVNLEYEVPDGYGGQGTAIAPGTVKSEKAIFTYAEHEGPLALDFVTVDFRDAGPEIVQPVAMTESRESRAPCGRNIKSPYVRSQTSSYLKIRSIEIACDRTLVKFVLYNNTESAFNVRVHNPGERGAFYIMDDKHNKIGHLKAVEGITTAPGLQPVEPNERFQFTLTFDHIDPTLPHLNVIEGDWEEEGFTSWHFYGVKTYK